MFRWFYLAFFIGPSLVTAAFTEIDSLISNAIQEKIFPGAVALISHKGIVVYHKAFGHYSYDTRSPHVTTDTLFDLASVTKPITTIATMLLCDSGSMSLNDHVYKYLPKFSNNGKSNVCIKHLLLHTSGITDEVFFKNNAKMNVDMHALLTCHPACFPGEKHIYSCSNMILLHTIIEQVSGMSFDRFVHKHITKPLGMSNTMFNPINIQRCAPSGSSPLRPKKIIQGIVHDDQAYTLGGVAGNAGLFSTAADLARLMDMLVHNGLHNGTQYIKKETINEWTKNQKFKWGYGWEIGRHLSDRAFGHFGWTGTSVWADKEQDVFCILLTNRTMIGSQPGNEKIRNVRIAFHELVVTLLGLRPFDTPPVPVF